MRDKHLYFFEYDRPGKRTPGRTGYRMEIEEAAKRLPGARPVLSSLVILKNAPEPKDWPACMKPEPLQPFMDKRKGKA